MVPKWVARALKEDGIRKGSREYKVEVMEYGGEEAFLVYWMQVPEMLIWKHVSVKFKRGVPLPCMTWAMGRVMTARLDWYVMTLPHYPVREDKMVNIAGTYTEKA